MAHRKTPSRPSTPVSDYESELEGLENMRMGDRDSDLDSRTLSRSNSSAAEDPKSVSPHKTHSHPHHGAYKTPEKRSPTRVSRSPSPSLASQPSPLLALDKARALLLQGEQEPLILRIRLPNYTYQEVDVAGLQSLLVKDLKQKIYILGLTYFPPHRMKLLFKQRALHDHEVLGDLRFEPYDEVDLVVRVTGDRGTPIGAATHTALDPPLLLRYDEFVESVTPRHLSRDVSVHAVVEIVLRANRLHHVLFLPAMRDVFTLCTLSSGFRDTERSSASSPSEEESAMQSGLCEPRVLLLRLDHRVTHDEDLDALAHTLESRRYNALVTPPQTHANAHTHRARYKGDLHTWRRYTAHPPVDCDLSFSHQDDPLPHVVTLTPREPLMPNTTYAVLMCNHVPSVPMHYVKSVYDMIVEGVGEDKLFLFHTQFLPGQPR